MVCPAAGAFSEHLEGHNRDRVTGVSPWGKAVFFSGFFPWRSRPREIAASRPPLPDLISPGVVVTIRAKNGFSHGKNGRPSSAVFRRRDDLGARCPCLSRPRADPSCPRTGLHCVSSKYGRRVSLVRGNAGDAQKLADSLRCEFFREIPNRAEMGPKTSPSKAPRQVVRFSDEGGPLRAPILTDENLQAAQSAYDADWRSSKQVFRLGLRVRHQGNKSGYGRSATRRCTVNWRQGPSASRPS